MSEAFYFQGEELVVSVYLKKKKKKKKRKKESFIASMGKQSRAFECEAKSPLFYYLYRTLS